METTRYCAFNKSRGIFLSLDVSVLDAALEPLKVLKVLIEGPGQEARTGLWLQRFKAVPVAQALTPFDLIYLDKNHCVVHAVALTEDGEFLPFSGEPSSALVLPSGTIAVSETQSGDQLIVVSAPQAGVGPARVAAPTAASASTRNAAPARTSPPPTSSTPTIPSAAFRAQGNELSPLDRFLSAQSASAAPVPPPAPKFTPWTEHTLRGQQAQSTPNSTPLPSSRAVGPASAAAPGTRFAAKPKPVDAPGLAETAVTPPSFMLPVSEPQPIAAAPEKPKIEYYPESVPTLGQRLLRWLNPRRAIDDNERRMRDRREAYRLDRPGLVAYFFTGGAPRPHPIEDISVTGFFMHTDHLWMPGTVIRMTLQRTGTLGDKPGDSVTVHSRMVRHGANGGGFEFVLSGFLE